MMCYYLNVHFQGQRVNKVNARVQVMSVDLSITQQRVITFDVEDLH